MCWSIRVYWTVLHNLFARFFSNLVDYCSYSQTQGICCYCCSHYYVCCNCFEHKQMRNFSIDGGVYDPVERNGVDLNTNELRQQQSSRIEHDYVIVDIPLPIIFMMAKLKVKTNEQVLAEKGTAEIRDIVKLINPVRYEEQKQKTSMPKTDDIDANYLQIEKRKIETEAFYRTIDRSAAEDILLAREDGTCLVRPYKESDISIKYIVSIYAQQEFFHLFIRQIKGQELYAIGQAKANEKYFTTPNEIIEFYKHNTLQCTNKQCSLSVNLIPIIV